MRAGRGDFHAIGGADRGDERGRKILPRGTCEAGGIFSSRYGRDWRNYPSAQARSPPSSGGGSGRRKSLIRRHRTKWVADSLLAPPSLMLRRLPMRGQLRDLTELLLSRPARAGAPAAAAGDRTGMFLLLRHGLAQRIERGAILKYGRARLRPPGAPLFPPQPIDRPVRQVERSDPLHRMPPKSE